MENVKICELCLEQIIKTEEFENLNWDEKQNLQILENLEITVSKDTKICSNCVNISHLTYNFKTSCLTNNDHLKTLIHPGIDDKLILEEVIVKKTKSESKNDEKVCRFCLNFSEVNSLLEVNLEQNVVLKDILERCLPEIDTNIVQNPLMCYTCSELLEKLYNFISRCKDTEVVRNLDPKIDVLLNENTSSLTVENNDKNINTSFVKEGNCNGMENPELQIKSEDFDINEDIKDSINESNSQKPKPHGVIKEKKFVCDICLFRTTTKYGLNRHNLLHKEPSEVNLFKCDYCPFATKWKNNLTHHTMRHKNLSEFSKFKCNDCPYKTATRSRLVTHLLVHKDPVEVNMFKCEVCPFQTKHKKSILRHKKEIHQISQCKDTEVLRTLDPKTDVLVNENTSLLTVENNDKNINESFMKEENCNGIENPELQIKSEDFDINEDIKDSINESNSVEEKDWKPKPHDTIKEKKFVCDICSYETTRPSDLKLHYLIHKEQSEVNLFKCDYCSFATKWKSNLKKHTIRHKNPSELPNKEWKQPVKSKNKFVCDICSHQTTRLFHLKQHYLIHKESSGVNVFKCDYCPFATKWKRCLARHTISHKTPSELTKVKCNDCPYETQYRRKFVTHIQAHKTSSQVNMYKCKMCPYQTKGWSDLQLHQEKHQKHYEIYTCDECNYQSFFKHFLTRHLQHHKQSKQPVKSSQNLKKVR